MLSVIQFVAGQSKAMQSSAKECRAVRSSRAKQEGEEPVRSVQCRAVKLSSVQCSTVHCSAVQCVVLAASGRGDQSSDCLEQHGHSVIWTSQQSTGRHSYVFTAQITYVAVIKGNLPIFWRIYSSLIKAAYLLSDECGYGKTAGVNRFTSGSTSGLRHWPQV